MRLFNSTSVLALSAVCALAVSGAPRAANAAEAAEATTLETLIVTAQKREENVQDAPLAITAVSGASLA